MDENPIKPADQGFGVVSQNLEVMVHHGALLACQRGSTLRVPKNDSETRGRDELGPTWVY